MIIAIHQPYFFPYLGYFGLIKNTDRWIVFDTPQFQKHGWIERNRILKPVQGWQYISIPLIKHSQKTKIIDIKIKNDEDWRKTIFDKLTVYKKKAPFYKETIKVIENSLSVETDSISKLNCNTIREVCNYIGIEWNFTLLSEMDLEIEEVKEADDWALNICKKLDNVTEYRNAYGGMDIFDKEKYSRNNITLRFYRQNLSPYNQKRKPFEPGLSVIDVMMFNSKEEINRQLDDFYLIT